MPLARYGRSGSSRRRRRSADGEALPAHVRLPDERVRLGEDRRRAARGRGSRDRKSTRLNSSHRCISYAVFCLKKKIRDENAHNDKSVHGVLNPTYQAGLRRDAVQPDIEAERKKRDEIEAGKSYCSRRFGGATCDDKSAQIYARFDKNDWRIQPLEFYRFHHPEVNLFPYTSLFR